MIELRMFCYNFACTIMSDIPHKKNQNKSSIQRKINLKGKLQKSFHFFFKLPDAPYLVYSLVG